MNTGSNVQPKRKIEELSFEDPTAIRKQPKAVPSIIKGVAVVRKPRVGEEFQAVLPSPAQPAYTSQHRSPESAPSQQQKAVQPQTDDPLAEQ